MIWALLAAYLTKRPPWVQSVVFGACTGLFVAAVANAGVRDPLISSITLQVVTVGAISGGAFFLALRAQRRRRPAESSPAAWVHVAYAGVWLLSIGAAVRALLSAGGLTVAVLAIVPIVLLAPPALLGIRSLLHRSSGDSAASPTEPTAPV
jgi:hypothetical protein